MGVAAFLSVANLLSLSRVPLGIAFAVVWGAPWGGRLPALGVLVVAAATDVLDGMFARRAAVVQPGRAEAASAGARLPHPHPHPAGTGSWLDPVCDKIFVATVLVAIWIHQHPPWSQLGLVLGREVIQAPLSLLYVAIPALRRWLHYDFRASLLGKAGTVSQFAAITAIVLELGAARSLAFVAFGFGMLAVGDYLLRALRLGLARRRAERPGVAAH